MVSGYEHKVLFISTEMHLGGAEKSLLAVLKHPAPVGFEAILICRPDSQIGDAARELGVSVLWHPMEQRDLTKKPFAYLRALFVLWRKLAPMGPSLLFGDGWRAIPYAVPLGRVLRKPSLMHIRDTDIPPSPMTRFLCRKAYYTTQVSHWQRDFLIEHGLINRKSSRVVYNGLEPDIYMRVGKSTSTKREELGLLQGDVGVVLPGYLLPSKGGEIFLDAAKRVGEKCPQTRFYFLGGHFPGTGSEENDTFPKKIRALAEASGLGERVCFLGHCEDVAEILWCMDIAVVPTVSEEAFGRVAVESMLAGLPVVASRSGGLPEVVADGETGYIVPKRDAEALADMLLRLIEDSPLRRQMGEAGRRRALELFEADAKAEEMWQVIQEVVR